MLGGTVNYVIVFESKIETKFCFYLRKSNIPPSSIGGFAPQEALQDIGTHIAEVDGLYTRRG